MCIHTCILRASEQAWLITANNCFFVFLLQKLPPVQSVAVSACGSSSLTVLVALQRQNLMPHLLQGEVGRFAQRLEEACEIPEAAGWLTELLSGGNNILHVLADITAPTPSVPGGGDSQTKRPSSAMGRESMRELFRRASRMANSSASSSSSPLIPLSSLEYLHHSSSDEGEGEVENDGPMRCIKMIQDTASVNPGMFLPLLQGRCVRRSCTSGVERVAPVCCVVHIRG